MVQVANKLSLDLKQTFVKKSVLVKIRSKKVTDFQSFFKFAIEQLDFGNSLFSSKILGLGTRLTKMSNLKHLFTM